MFSLPRSGRWPTESRTSLRRWGVVVPGLEGHELPYLLLNELMSKHNPGIKATIRADLQHESRFVNFLAQPLALLNRHPQRFFYQDMFSGSQRF